MRTFQEFATADLVSAGRVEIIFGRRAFLDNFPLFGHDLNDYDDLFVEKIGLFAMLNAPVVRILAEPVRSKYSSPTSGERTMIDDRLGFDSLADISI